MTAHVVLYMVADTSCTQQQFWLPPHYSFISIAYPLASLFFHRLQNYDLNKGMHSNAPPLSLVNLLNCSECLGEHTTRALNPWKDKNAHEMEISQLHLVGHCGAGKALQEGQKLL